MPKNRPRCHCGGTMKRNATTTKGTTRWRCTLCGASRTKHRPDITNTAAFTQFIDELLRILFLFLYGTQGLSLGHMITCFYFYRGLIVQGFMDSGGYSTSGPSSSFRIPPRWLTARPGERRSTRSDITRSPSQLRVTGGITSSCCGTRETRLCKILSITNTDVLRSAVDVLPLQRLVLGAEQSVL